MNWSLEISFLPIVGRELRRLARRSLTYRVRTAAAVGAAIISLGVVAVNVSSGGTPVTLGRALFVPLALLAFGFSLMTGPVLTGDCLSEEKRAGTMGLLFLTNLNGFHVVTGKLVAMALPAVHCLLAILPILAISFFMGGVTGGEFLRTAVVLGGTLLLSLAGGMLASSLCHDGRKALAGAVLALLGLTIGLPGLALFFAGGVMPAHSWILTASPAYAVWLVPEAHYVGHGGEFWATMVVHQILIWTAFLLAGFLLSRSWQDAPTVLPAVPGWSRRPWWDWRRPMTRARRERLLAKNPILWLAARSGSGNGGIWLFLVGTLGVWLGGAYGMHQKWLNAFSVFFVMYALHAVLKLWIGWEAGRRFADDRGSGALELLLCTPLDEAFLLQGWLTYLKRRFLAPILGLLLVDILLVNAGIGASGWWGGEGAWGVTFTAGMGLFLADTYALCWVGLWQGLTARNPMRATLNTLLYVLLLPMLICAGVFALVGFLAAGYGLPLGALTATWFAVGYLTDAVLCGRAMTLLEERFRVSAIYGLDFQFQPAGELESPAIVDRVGSGSAPDPQVE